MKKFVGLYSNVYPSLTVLLRITWNNSKRRTMPSSSQEIRQHSESTRKVEYKFKVPSINSSLKRLSNKAERRNFTSRSFLSNTRTIPTALKFCRRSSTTSWSKSIEKMKTTLVFRKVLITMLQLQSMFKAWAFWTHLHRKNKMNPCLMKST